VDRPSETIRALKEVHTETGHCILIARERARYRAQGTIAHEQLSLEEQSGSRVGARA
jgi:hypothetical protein